MSNFVHTKVDADRLCEAAMNIEANLSLLDKAFKDVGEALQGTLQPSWSGPSSASFFEKYSVDSQTFISHTKALYSVNNQLREAAGIYDRADSKAGDLVSKLKME